ncbi:hypothetical protein RFI_09352, partial [Reticulomyxa filosa]
HAPPVWFKKVWKNLFYVHFLIIVVCNLVAFFSSKNSSFPIFVYRLFLNSHIAFGAMLAIFVVYLLRARVHIAWAKGASTLKRREHEETVTQCKRWTTRDNSFNTSRNGSIQKKSDNNHNSVIGNESSQQQQQQQQQHEKSSMNTHSIMLLQQLRKAQNKLDIIILALVVISLSGIYSLINQFLEIKGSIHDSLYSSPYPTKSSYIAHIVFGSFNICLFLAWSFTKNSCCFNAKLSRLSVCFICCPYCACVGSPTYDDDNNNNNAFNYGGPDNLADLQQSQMQGDDQQLHVLQMGPITNEHAIANAEGNIARILHERNDSSDSGGVAYTKTNANLEIETTVCLFYGGKRRIELENGWKSSDGEKRVSITAAPATMKKDKDEVKEVNNVMTIELKNKCGPIRVVLYFWENVFQSHELRLAQKKKKRR